MQPRIRMVAMGSTSSGKSSLLQQYFMGTFSQQVEPTMGALFMNKIYTYPHGKTTKISVFDLSGMHKFRPIFPIYYRAEAILCIYDVTNLQSFAEAQAYAKEVRKAKPNALIAIVGNKSDLFQQIKVPHHQASQYAQDNGFLFALTSAKLNTGIIELMKMIAERIDQLQSSAGPQP